ncbi:bile acid:sodium symporter family protein [Streptomyces fagopyri]|uniref:bile acid:sodium symporter family protein n=1 Tax=Streptomyces fagopyri TaxID=2662397 RepID=UPI0033F05DB6
MVIPKGSRSGGLIRFADRIQPLRTRNATVTSASRAAATMFAVGLGATVAALRSVLTDVPLLGLALIANMVAVPLLGWGIAALFGLPTATYVALVLVASSPGGPFGAKLAMVQKGDVATAGAVEVLLAAIGSLSFGPTVSGILTASDVGKGVSLDVAALVGTVVLLQLVPFAIGLLRRYATSVARSWHRSAAVVSNVTLLIVLAGMLLGNWRDVVALLGSRSLLAGFVLATAAFAVGTLLATGPPVRRTTMGAVASVRNAGPAPAAIGIAFDDQPAVLGALAAVLLSGLAAAVPIAAVLGGRRADRTDEANGVNQADQADQADRRRSTNRADHAAGSRPPVRIRGDDPPSTPLPRGVTPCMAGVTVLTRTTRRSLSSRARPTGDRVTG